MTPLPFKYALLLENNAPNSFAITSGKWGAKPSKAGLKIQGPHLLAKVFTEEDAQFIVKACNSHYELLGVCKDFFAAKTPKEKHHAMVRMEEAIAKVEK